MRVIPFIVKGSRHRPAIAGEVVPPAIIPYAVPRQLGLPGDGLIAHPLLPHGFYLPPLAIIHDRLLSRNKKAPDHNGPGAKIFNFNCRVSPLTNFAVFHV